MRSVLPDGRYKTKDVAGDRHPADGRERQVSGHQRLACLRQLPQKTDPDTDRLLGVVVESVVPVGVIEVIREHGIAEERQPVARRTTLCPRVWPPVRRTTTPGATSYSFSNGRSWLRYTSTNRSSADRSTSGNPPKVLREKSGDDQNSASAAAR